MEKISQYTSAVERLFGFFFLMAKNLGSFIPSTFYYLLLIFILFVHPERM